MTRPPRRCGAWPWAWPPRSGACRPQPAAATRPGPAGSTGAATTSSCPPVREGAPALMFRSPAPGGRQPKDIPGHPMTTGSSSRRRADAVRRRSRRRLWSPPAEAGCGDRNRGLPHRQRQLPHRPASPTRPRRIPPAARVPARLGRERRGHADPADMVETATARGYAVIAPDGTPREGRNGYGWGFSPERPGPRDEIAFLKAVRDDAIARHGIDAGRMSSAASPSAARWSATLPAPTPAPSPPTCRWPAPSGTPCPSACAGPVDLFHTHGWTDGSCRSKAASCAEAMDDDDHVSPRAMSGRRCRSGARPTDAARTPAATARPGSSGAEAGTTATAAGGSTSPSTAAAMGAGGLGGHGARLVRGL
jgi:hypothetical protein